MSKLWGGRFSKETNKLVEEFTKSSHFDYKLAKYDIQGSIIHVHILKRAGLLTSEEEKKLLNGLDQILKKIESKTDFNISDDCEDIHTYIQNELQADTKVADVALKLHMARSRNDQVVLATKLYCKDELIKTLHLLNSLSGAIILKADENKDLIIPGFTHLQHAQPVYLQDYLLAYVCMLQSDFKRIKYIMENTTLTFGAGALAGTPILNEVYDNEGHVHSTANSLYSVSDRDFIIEIISALSIIAMHLSRLSEDLIIWATKEFNFIDLDDAFCTGSSLMPQKKNPDVLELIRGYAGRLYGHLVSVLTMMKGLPLTYNRDMQLDKEPLFDSFEIVSKELQVLKGVIETIKFNKDKIKQHLEDEALYATDLVYYLVSKGLLLKRLILLSESWYVIPYRTRRTLKIFRKMF